MRYSKRTGWKRPKKFQATKRETLAQWADEELDLFRSDIAKKHRAERKLEDRRFR